MFYFQQLSFAIAVFSYFKYACVCILCDGCAVCLYLQGVLTSTIATDGLAEVDRLTLGTVKVWGVPASPTVVTMRVNGTDANLAYDYNPEVRCFMPTYTLAIDIVRITDTIRRTIGAA